MLDNENTELGEEQTLGTNILFQQKIVRLCYVTESMKSISYWNYCNDLLKLFSEYLVSNFYINVCLQQDS